MNFYIPWKMPTALNDQALNIRKLEKKLKGNQEYLEDVNYMEREIGEYLPLRDLTLKIGYTKKVTDKNFGNMISSHYFLMVYPDFNLAWHLVEKNGGTFGLETGLYDGWRFSNRIDHSRFPRRYKVIRRLGQASWDKNTMNALSGAKKVGLEQALERIKEEAFSLGLDIKDLKDKDNFSPGSFYLEEKYKREGVVIPKNAMQYCLQYQDPEIFEANYMIHVDPIFKREIINNPPLSSFNLSEGINVKFKKD